MSTAIYILNKIVINSLPQYYVDATDLDYRCKIHVTKDEATILKLKYPNNFKIIIADNKYIMVEWTYDSYINSYHDMIKILNELRPHKYE